MQLPFGLALVAAALGLLWFFKNREEQVPSRLRESWGKPIQRWRDFEAIDAYHRWLASESPEAHCLDDRTWDDLGLDRIFAHVDRTSSTVGAQSLYRRLRTTPALEELARFEGLVEHYTEQEDARYSAQRNLSKLSHPSGFRLWTLCVPGTVQAHWWYIIFPIMGLAALGSILAGTFWNPRAFLLLVAIAAINTTLRLVLASTAFHLFGLCRQVGPLLKCADSVLEPVAAVGLLDRAEISADLRSLRSLRTSTRWAGRNFTMESEIAASMWEYLNLLFLIDATAVFFATGTLTQKREELARVIGLVGDVDTALSTASLRAGAGRWTVPEFTDRGTQTEMDAAWHPLVTDVVANSVAMTPGRGLIITGSNMSGKSTFLRMVGIAVVLAQSIHTCPARRYSSPRLRVRTAIGRSDDLSLGKSYYLAEVDAVLDLLSQSATPEPHLFMFDELFRGTNTIERLAAGEAVLKALVRGNSGEDHNLVIAATHDRELVELLLGHYDPHHFGEKVTSNGVSFDFRLESGPAVGRNAIALLELHGAPPDLIIRARERVAELDADRGTRH